MGHLNELTDPETYDDDDDIQDVIDVYQEMISNAVYEAV
jgi:hypothetical protein